ncbi:hypothetical protein FB451DRAFT_1186946 [Mycena latifolia]|nr:hypothetical protein FB451DRAFT_1186946 [Mycena latifolia]
MHDGIDAPADDGNWERAGGCCCDTGVGKAGLVKMLDHVAKSYISGKMLDRKYDRAPPHSRPLVQLFESEQDQRRHERQIQGRREDVWDVLKAIILTRSRAGRHECQNSKKRGEGATDWVGDMETRQLGGCGSLVGVSDMKEEMKDGGTHGAVNLKASETRDARSNSGRSGTNGSMTDTTHRSEELEASKGRPGDEGGVDGLQMIIIAPAPHFDEK